MEDIKIIDRNATWNADESISEGTPAEPTPATTEAATAATPATTDQPAPAPAPETTAAAEPTPATTEPPAKEETADPFALLGMAEDQHFRKIVDAYKAGKLDEYIAVATTDYDKMTAEDLFRIELKEKHPKLSPEKIEVLLEDKIEREYGYDTDEDSPGGIRKEADAAKIREGLKQKQAEYKIKGDQPATTTQDTSEFEAFFNSNEAVKAFETNRLVKLGSGDTAFNFEVPAEVDLRQATFDPNTFYGYLFDKGRGQLDMNKWIKAFAYVTSMEQVEQRLIDHGRKMAQIDAEKERRNAPDQSYAAPETKGGDEIKIIGWR